MSYGLNIADGFPQAGVYTGRILKGEKPAELPVIQGTKVRACHQCQDRRAIGNQLPALCSAEPTK